MLVLSRKIGERIHIGNDIVLEVRRISGNRVTLAVEAPREMRILRGELEQAAREFEVDVEPETTAATETSRNGVHTGRTMPTNRLRMLGAFPAHQVASDFSV